MLAILLTAALVIETQLPLPGGGVQKFSTPTRTADFQPIVRDISFVLQCPIPAGAYRIEISTDLINWTFASQSTNSTTVVIDCRPVTQRFWRITPLP